MKYIVYYKTDDGKNRFERIEASSKSEAKKKLYAKWGDVKEIVDVVEN